MQLSAVVRVGTHARVKAHITGSACPAVPRLLQQRQHPLHLLNQHLDHHPHRHLHHHLHHHLRQLLLWLLRLLQQVSLLGCKRRDLSHCLRMPLGMH